ncbi:hypothetical protein E2F46_13005 [Luteimonas aestuarii]|uniref:Uncharacterized protein n=1 Tax=Luteimonas aestuarii TaxID=453837 RepID=A0A4R5TQH6_9GAMM|nr:hypothetical protein [Luteimonas aestuarii]TDK22680.1 hypothetical protein E2F46_13005 [Luteimonas aestuarii]
MTGEQGAEGLYEGVDCILAVMQVVAATVNSIGNTYHEETRDQEDRAQVMITAGLGLPVAMAMQRTSWHTKLSRAT